LEPEKQAAKRGMPVVTSYLIYQSKVVGVVLVLVSGFFAHDDELMSLVSHDLF